MKRGFGIPNRVDFTELNVNFCVCKMDSGRRMFYLRLTGKNVARTEEVAENQVLCDYDADGNLVGVEVLE